MLQTDWQEQTEKQMMEVDLTIYDDFLFGVHCVEEGIIIIIVY